MGSSPQASTTHPRRLRWQATVAALAFLTLGLAVPAHPAVAAAAVDGRSVTFTDGGLQPLVPARLLDTRAGSTTVDGAFAGTGPVGAGGRLDVTVVGRGGVPEVGVSAVVLTVTAVGATETSFVTVWRRGTPQPGTSNLNTAPRRGVVANTTVVKVADAVTLYNHAGTVDLVVDVTGWLPVGTDFVPSTPARLLDTRPDGTTVDGRYRATGPLAAGGTLDLRVTGRSAYAADRLPADGATAVVLNVTAIEPSDVSFLTVWPTGMTRPLASSLNDDPGTGTVANLVVAGVGDGGAVSLYNHAGSVHVAVDVLGWFRSERELRALQPLRLLDTRETGGPLGPGEQRDVQVTGHANGPGPTAAAAVLTVTAVGATAPSYVTVWATDEPRPLASTLNPDPMVPAVPGLVMTGLSADGRLSLYNHAGTVDLLVDVVGWFPTGTVETTMTLADDARVYDGSDVDGWSADRGTVVMATGVGPPPPGAALVVAPTPGTPEGLVAVVTSVGGIPKGPALAQLRPGRPDEAFLRYRVRSLPAAPAPLAGASWAFGSDTDVACLLGEQPPRVSGSARVSPGAITIDIEIGSAVSRPRVRLETLREVNVSVAVLATAAATCDLVAPATIDRYGLVALRTRPFVELTVGGATTTRVGASTLIRRGIDVDGVTATDLASLGITNEGDMSPPAMPGVAVGLHGGVEWSVLVFGVVGYASRSGVEIALGAAGAGPQSPGCWALTGRSRSRAAAPLDRWAAGVPVALPDLAGDVTTFASLATGCPIP